MSLISKTSAWAAVVGVAAVAALLAVVQPEPAALRVIELEPVVITVKAERAVAQQDAAPAAQMRATQ